ncbi:phage tail tape measure protein [Pseudomonas amygdali pv. lachrymans]|uniref:Lambda family phage tail tape measure protein n=2 Tax=Pseudomonas amygdali pv. lachrymans TaxID=53707 RepID=A0ABR5KYC3_PSEAV|nr:phage tail tape measure protein [Pseudomonas amygdali]AXH56319.1 phage tail tape measure protein [Pseudomonas amygdali pv. lachrymans str. M301315]KPC20413.1 Lambda family phage tail tape measure protein [Pseudomonas amygdali pv. lachrymans]PWD04070.1 phage tail tape measure protein [Pseudomonas amygdali pv. lachrymans]QWA52578.1 phage tail tape measure protein [Pseudomonas amygdali pv. lachrymans]RMT04086.1 Lambda family phage tail tape measure protein [Pseudomonas amygdali pv. lachrymans]
MALTSRLAIEVDSRSAEQKVNDLRRGLQALNDAGLRTGPIVSGAGNAINGAGQNARSATAQVQSLERQVKSLGSAAAGIAGPLAAAFSAKAFYDAAEAYSTLTNRMKLVTDGAGELAAAQKAVFAISQSSYQPLNATAELYQRIATNQKELKLTGEGVAGVVGTISKTLAISGASAASANAALIQLGQAFASGVLRGEELNSVMEQAPALAQAIAAGMGKTVGELRTLGAAGLLTADSVVKALQAQQQAVDQLFARTAVTIGNSITALDNSFTQLVGKMDQASGVSATISSAFVAASKSMDALTSDSSATYLMLSRVSNAAETLAYIIGGRLVLSTGQAIANLALSTKASIQQAAALYSATAATLTANKAEAESAKQAVLSAQSKQADANTTLARANAELVAAEQKLAADRMRQESELNNMRSVQAALVAERELEVSRLSSQISEQGRAAARNRMAIARLDEIKIIKQIQAAEIQLAATTTAASVEIQQAYVVRSAAAAGVAETTLAANAAIRASETATAAVTTASKALLVASAAGRGLLGLLTGPVGLIAMTGAVAYSFLSVGDSAKDASASLVSHNATVAESIEKYKALSAEQQRLQKITWAEQQAKELKTAESALDDFTYKIQTGIVLGPFAAQFRTMIDEVKAGKRPLDDVTKWIQENSNATPAFIKTLSELAVTQQESSKSSADFAAKLAGVDAASKALTGSTTSLSAAQAGSSTQTKAQLGEWQKYIAKLTEARDLVGANEKAEAAYRAGKMGLTKEQAAQASIVAEQTDLLKKYEDAVKTADKAQQSALRSQLIALYTQQQAAEDATAAVKKSHEEAAKAAETSANKQIEQMQRVINAALKLQGGPQIDLGMQKKRTGYDLLTNGATPLAPTRLTPAQLADRQLRQVTEGTKPNKNAGKEKAYQEDAGTKMLDDARQRYAVLQQQSKELINQDGTIKSIGTEQKKLVELEAEIAQLKEKKTLTTAQKQVLAMADPNLAQQKQNAALEKETELRKTAYEETQKLAAFQTNLNSQLSKEQIGLSNSLAGQGMGDQARARLQEEFAIQEQYQSQLDNLLQQRNEGKISQDLYSKQTNALNAALQSRLAMQQKYYSDVDKAQSDWTLGANSALENYLEQSRDVAGQTKQLFTNAFSNMEDAVVNFVKTGKLSFKDFANGVIEDLIRIQVRQAAAGFLSTAFSALSGVGSGAAATSSSALGASAAGYGSKYGFSDGGYTGDGGKFQPKGVVHGGEFVVKKEVVSQPGAREFLERMNANTKGYADGGYVGSSAAAATSSSQSTSSSLPGVPNIVQHITVGGSVDSATKEDVRRSAEEGAKAAYQLVLSDFKRNGPIRQLAARR